MHVPGWRGMDKGKKAHERLALKGWNSAALTSSAAEGSTRMSGMPGATRYTSTMVW